MREELKPCPFCGGKAEIAQTFDARGLGGYHGRCTVNPLHRGGIGCACPSDRKCDRCHATGADCEQAITAWNARSNPPQEERSDPLDLAAADDNRPADLAAADAAVARIMAMSDEEIMAEPGAAQGAVEAGKVIAHAVALHDIRTVRDKLQAAFDDQDQAPGVRNFSGGLAEHLTDALAALSQPADDNHKALVEAKDGWLPIVLAPTDGQWRYVRLPDGSETVAAFEGDALGPRARRWRTKAFAYHNPSRPSGETRGGVELFTQAYDTFVIGDLPDGVYPTHFRPNDTVFGSGEAALTKAASAAAITKKAPAHD